LLYRTTALTDASGAIVEAYDYDAYGNTLIYNAPGTGSNWWADDASTTDQPACEFLFTGQRYDYEILAYYYKRREYLSQWGRFASKDPLDRSKELNLFEITLGNPLNSTDPFGLFDLVQWLKTIAFRKIGVSRDVFNRTIPFAYGMSLNFVTVDANTYLCCKSNSLHNAWEVSVSAEAYGAIGYSSAAKI
jgi:RHS repeat-associated protein